MVYVEYRVREGVKGRSVRAYLRESWREDGKVRNRGTYLGTMTPLKRGPFVVWQWKPKESFEQAVEQDLALPFWWHPRENYLHAKEATEWSRGQAGFCGQGPLFSNGCHAPDEHQAFTIEKEAAQRACAPEDGQEAILVRLSWMKGERKYGKGMIPFWERDEVWLRKGTYRPRYIEWAEENMVDDVRSRETAKEIAKVDRKYDPIIRREALRLHVPIGRIGRKSDLTESALEIVRQNPDSVEHTNLARLMVRWQQDRERARAKKR